jgi:hypothetical protein
MYVGSTFFVTGGAIAKFSARCLKNVTFLTPHAPEIREKHKNVAAIA